MENIILKVVGFVIASSFIKEVFKAIRQKQANAWGMGVENPDFILRYAKKLFLDGLVVSMLVLSFFGMFAEKGRDVFGDRLEQAAPFTRVLALYCSEMFWLFVTIPVFLALLSLLVILMKWDAEIVKKVRSCAKKSLEVSVIGLCLVLNTAVLHSITSGEMDIFIYHFKNIPVWMGFVSVSVLGFVALTFIGYAGWQAYKWLGGHIKRKK